MHRAMCVSRSATTRRSSSRRMQSSGCRPRKQVFEIDIEQYLRWSNHLARHLQRKFDRIEYAHPSPNILNNDGRCRRYGVQFPGNSARPNDHISKSTKALEYGNQKKWSQPSSKGPADWFPGTVRIDPLFQANAPARASGASVTFEPGARTVWHTHPLGQTLHCHQRLRLGAARGRPY
jgi:hypothetical protein